MEPVYKKAEKNSAVGVVSYQNKGNGEYYIGCLGVKKEYQGQGIGTLRNANRQGREYKILYKMIWFQDYWRRKRRNG